MNHVVDAAALFVAKLGGAGQWNRPMPLPIRQNLRESDPMMTRVTPTVRRSWSTLCPTSVESPKGNSALPGGACYRPGR